MTELVRRLGPAHPTTASAGSAHPPDADRPGSLVERALRQAARELLLAQSSDWPFILRTGTSPEYARRRVTDHLLRFTKIYEQFIHSQLDESWLAHVESQDDIFPNIHYQYFG